jgi:PAS domain S-box-containing protein
VRRSEEIYRTLVETAPDAIMVNRDGVIGFANPRLARLLRARDVTEVIGRPVDEFVDEEAQTHVDVQATTAAAAEEEEPEQEEAAAGPGATARPARLLKVRRLDGTLVETEPSAARVELDGRPAVQVALRDLTERRRAEREIEERNQGAGGGEPGAGAVRLGRRPRPALDLAAHHLGFAEAVPPRRVHADRL